MQDSLFYRTEVIQLPEGIKSWVRLHCCIFELKLEFNALTRMNMRWNLSPNGLLHVTPMTARCAFSEPDLTRTKVHSKRKC